MNKPNLSTFEDALEREGRWKIGNTEVKMNSRGMFEVINDGVRRQYEDVRDCWRAI